VDKAASQNFVYPQFEIKMHFSIGDSNHYTNMLYILYQISQNEVYNTLSIVDNTAPGVAATQTGSASSQK